MRTFPALLTGLVIGLTMPITGWAQDDEDLFEDEEDDDFFEDDEEEEDTPEERFDDGDDLDLFDSEEDTDLDEFMDEEEEGFDLLEDDEDAKKNDSGDDAGTYRRAQENMAGMSVDEEIAGWEEYLATYAGTPYTEKITQRIDQLMDSLYSTGLDDEGVVDAMRQQLSFSQAMQLENINPRTRLQAGFEWGLPDYINLMVDYEHAFARNLSVHGGIRNRYTGWNVESGVHWALVKSTRTNTLVTFIGDIHFNTSPAFLGVRPQLAFGKRIGKVDLQGQAGVDLELRSPSGLRIIGGLNANYRASDTVGMFLESNVNMKNFSWEGKAFMYNVVTFGMTFYPKKDGEEVSEKLNVDMGATVPYSRQYWAYHYGSVMGRVNYNMD
jgi:hypothetical protein